MVSSAWAATTVVSQRRIAALSRKIRLLEEQLGARLFDRNSRNVALTSAGEALLPIVERLTADFDHAFSELAQSLAGRRGRVVIGALPSVAAGTLPAEIVLHRPREQDQARIARPDRAGAFGRRSLLWLRCADRSGRRRRQSDRQ